MARDITITNRELSPFEQLVLGLLCEGKTNSAIAREAYAFGTMGVIAGYGAIAALVGGIVMLLLSLAGWYIFVALLIARRFNPLLFNSP